MSDPTPVMLHGRGAANGQATASVYDVPDPCVRAVTRLRGVPVDRHIVEVDDPEATVGKGLVDRAHGTGNRFGQLIPLKRHGLVCQLIF